MLGETEPFWNSQKRVRFLVQIDFFQRSLIFPVHPGLFPLDAPLLGEPLKEERPRGRGQAEVMRHELLHINCRPGIHFL